MPRCQDEARAERMHRVLALALAGFGHSEIISAADGLRPLKNRRVLFAVELGESGVNLEYYAMLRRIRKERDLFTGCTGAMLLDGMGELYTKSVARELVFAANRAGCAFIGRPLVEGTGKLHNFHVLAQTTGTTREEAYFAAARDLVQRLMSHQRPRPQPGRHLLVLHASSHKSSNTFALWKLLEPHMTGWHITEIGLRNGSVVDCSGCPYTMCLHFGEQGECFYGGVIVDDVYPAIERCDALLMLCPNYNDALSANLTAFVNRMTAIFRVRRFYEKALYSIIVSGYSGGDIIAEQLIAGLCMNKTFFLPPGFALLETANDAGSALMLPGIDRRISAFARTINQN